jgi:hypothetical protein
MPGFPGILIAQPGKISPQDVLTQKKRQIAAKTYLENIPGRNSRPASIGTTLVASRVRLITPAVSGGTVDNYIPLGEAPCCSS